MSSDNRGRLFLASVFVVLAASCGSSGSPAVDAKVQADAMDGASDSASALTPEICMTMCQLSLMVVCPNQPSMSGCVDTCLSERSSPCAPPGAIFFKCFIAGGVSAAMCDQMQQAVVPATGKCVQEANDLAACLVNQPH